MLRICYIKKDFPFSGSLNFLFLCKKVECELYEQHDEHDEHEVLHLFAAALDCVLCAEICAQCAADSGRNCKDIYDFAAEKEDYNARHVTCKIGKLCAAAGCQQIIAEEGGEKHNHECACARADKTVIDAHAETDKEADDDFLDVCAFNRLWRNHLVLLPDEENRNDWQSNEHDCLESFRRDEKGKARADACADESDDSRPHGSGEIDFTACDVLESCRNTAYESGEFIARKSIMGWQTDEKVSRKGDNTAAACNCIDKAGEEDERTENKQHIKTDLRHFLHSFILFYNVISGIKM